MASQYIKFPTYPKNQHLTQSVGVVLCRINGMIEEESGRKTAGMEDKSRILEGVKQVKKRDYDNHLSHSIIKFARRERLTERSFH